MLPCPASGELDMQDRSVGPQFGSLEIAKEHVGRLVGPGGSVIRGIEEGTGAKVVVLDRGLVHFLAPTPQQFAEADRAIGSIVGNTIKVCFSSEIRDRRLTQESHPLVAEFALQP